MDAQAKQKPTLTGERLIRCGCVLLLGFLFSEVHIVFGARPVALALVALLSGEVYFALLGAVVGTLFGEGGFIGAISLVITLFVRVIIGTADKESGLFSESLLLRMSAGLLGGFVRAVYEWLINGVSVASVLYGVAMLLLPPALVFLLSGLLEHPVSDILLGKSPPPTLVGTGLSARISALHFYLSALIFLHITCRSLTPYSVLGIDTAFVFASAAVIYIAMRFGAIYGGCVGFAVTLGTAGVQSVSYALLGISAGFLFPFGIAYALSGGALAFALWSGYSEGLSGVLASLPELTIAIALLIPVLKKGNVRREAPPKADRSSDTLSAVGTMALSYRGKYAENTERFISSILAMAAVSERAIGRKRPTAEEYKECVGRAIDSFCKGCEHNEYCEREGVCPARDRIEILTKILVSGERISPSDINTEKEFCDRCEEISQRINESASRLEYERARLFRCSKISDELTFITKMLMQARERDGEDIALNAERSSACEAALSSLEIGDFSVRVFGRRRERIFLAVRDKDGKIVSSERVKQALSSALSGELCEGDYYRDGEIAMLECTVKEKYAVDFASASRPAQGRVSGDSSIGLRTDDGVFYGILCDGMGRGEAAREASDYLLSLAKNLLSFGAGQDTLVGLLSCLMARRGEAHSTLDIFRFDLYTGEASFIKCGAAPSYVKRSGALYRIGGEGTPIGVGAEALGERIRVDAGEGDVVVMTSDGVVDTQAAALSFIDRLSREVGAELNYLAEELVASEDTGGDDRTALVMRIRRCSKSTADT